MRVVRLITLAVIVTLALPLWMLGLAVEFLWSAFVSGRRAYPAIYEWFFQ